jgi:hypothetical protein
VLNESDLTNLAGASGDARPEMTIRDMEPYAAKPYPLSSAHTARPTQQVAHRAAHEVGGRQAPQRREEHVHAGQRPHPLGQPLHHRYSLTGIPAAPMRSFASRTVYEP